jgi:hypothetical protein
VISISSVLEGEDVMAKEPNPCVMMHLQKDGELQTIDGYLVQTPDGRCWMCPTPQEHLEKPDLSTAYELDPAQLKELTKRDPDGRRMFHYPGRRRPPQ